VSAERLQLLDWKRQIFALYERIRRSPDPAAAWRDWRAVRHLLFTSHPQSPIPEPGRAAFMEVPYYDYDPAARALADVEESTPVVYDVPTSEGGSYQFTRFGVARFELRGQALRLDLFWLEGYGGGLYLPFRDATSGAETYGAGRYLLDTIKGADLGAENGRLVFDFNFAYHPSCVYDPRWVCPLAPPSNRLPVPVRAGERLARRGVPAGDPGASDREAGEGRSTRGVGQR
jgi:uncharacterized protein (DUF1684 family)